jgi:hypothetical protein
MNFLPYKNYYDEAHSRGFDTFPELVSPGGINIRDPTGEIGPGFHVCRPLDFPNCIYHGRSTCNYKGRRDPVEEKLERHT